MRVAAFLASVAAAAFLCSCGGADVEPLRIGINPWPGYEYLYLAQEKGFFADEGASIQLLEFSSLGDTRRAFEREQIDGMTCTLIELLQARDQSRRSPQAILATDFSHGTDVILARRPVADIRGLRGEKVGAEVASLGMYMLARALELSEMRLEDVTVVPMDQTSMPAALAQGAVDAVVTYPPSSVEIQREGAGREHVSSKEFEQALAGVQLLSLEDQERFLGETGRFEQTIQGIDRVLRAVGQVTGPDRTRHCVASGLKTLAAAR